MSREGFDSDGNRTNIVNAKAARFSFQFDLAGGLTNSLSAAGRITSSALNPRRLVSKITQPSGSQTLLFYDGAGRLTNSQDAVGSNIRTYDGKGRLLSVSENGLANSWRYDRLDRLTNYTDCAGNILRYAYDAVGNLTNLMYPDGKQVAYMYDSANRLSTVTDWAGRKTQYFYDANNRVTNILHANLTSTRRIYDAAGRLAHQQDIAPGGGLICQIDYGYDTAGQIIGETNQPPASAALAVPATMSFDGDDALTNFAGTAVINDANGNMTFGPLTNSNFFNYTYDARNRLTAVLGVTNVYDPAGNRVAFTNGGVATAFVVNPNAALSQVLVRSGNSGTNYFVYGLGLLYQVNPTGSAEQTLTFHYDYRGSTVAVTDDGGNVTDRYSYSPYGTMMSHTGTNNLKFLYNGEYGVQTDPTGLLYMRARFYNPTICRFLNPDPLGFTAGPNLYAYVNGNPVGDWDPIGLINWGHLGTAAFNSAGAFVQSVILARTIAATGGQVGPSYYIQFLEINMTMKRVGAELAVGLTEQNNSDSSLDSLLDAYPSNPGEAIGNLLGPTGGKIGGFLYDTHSMLGASREFSRLLGSGRNLTLNGLNLGFATIAAFSSEKEMVSTLSRPRCTNTQSQQPPSGAQINPLLTEWNIK